MWGRCPHAPGRGIIPLHPVLRGGLGRGAQPPAQAAANHRPHGACPGREARALPETPITGSRPKPQSGFGLDPITGGPGGMIPPGRGPGRQPR